MFIAGRKRQVILFCDRIASRDFAISHAMTRERIIAKRKGQKNLDAFPFHITARRRKFLKRCNGDHAENFFVSAKHAVINNHRSSFQRGQ